MRDNVSLAHIAHIAHATRKLAGFGSNKGQCVFQYSIAAETQDKINDAGHPRCRFSLSSEKD